MNDALETCKLNNPDDGFGALECVASTLGANADMLNNRLDILSAGVDIFFLLFAAILMFVMQAGFAMLCAGSVRRKNVQNTLLKNVLDACGCSVAFFACGYAFAYGGTNGVITADEMNQYCKSTFIGHENFFLMDFDNFAFWMYQFTLAATTTTIVAGCLAERSQMISYFLYSILLSGFVFPVVAHSVWSIDGFLNPNKSNRLFGSGMVDFAGAGVVHVTGGLTALIASWILGPRKDRFPEVSGSPLHRPNPLRGHSVPLQVLGTLLLWFGWYGFNTGSIRFVSIGGYASVAALSAVTTTLGAASGTISSLGLSAYISQQATGEVAFDVGYALNGCLSGLVGVTGACALIEPWAGLVIGSVAGVIYVFGSRLLSCHQIDDAVDAIPVHLFNGVWGVIAVGLFASPEKMDAVYHHSEHVGWFYSWGRGSSDASLLAANVVGIFFIVAVVTIVVTPFFFFLCYMGWFRSDPLEEIIGLDFRYKGCVDDLEDELSMESRKDAAVVELGKTSGHYLHHPEKKDKLRRISRNIASFEDVERIYRSEEAQADSNETLPSSTVQSDSPRDD